MSSKTKVKAWFLYVIRTLDGNLYTGITTDVDRRFDEHCSQGSRSAKYLFAHPPEAIVFSTQVGDRSLALKVEHWFKRLSSAQKEQIVELGKLKFDRKTGRIRS
jgi:putative endonuclease